MNKSGGDISRPLLWEYPPDAATANYQLFAVGSDREHMNRRGSTLHQLGELAQADNLFELLESRKSHIFILEDLNRGKNDTVIAGVVATEQQQENGVGLTLNVLHVRDNYRGQGLGNYAVGKFMSDIIVDHVPATSLTVPIQPSVSKKWQTTLAQKGFHHHGNSASLRLPGVVIPPHRQMPPLDELDKEICQRQWSGMAGRRIYRDGELVGTLNYSQWDGDHRDSQELTILNAAGSPIATWPVDSRDVNWDYSAALRLLNPPMVDE